MSYRSSVRGAVFALAAIATVAGSITIAAADEKEIAVMLPAAGDPYFKMKAYGYVDEGKKRGYKVTVYDTGGYGNLQKQVSQIEDVITRKVSGIVWVPFLSRQSNEEAFAKLIRWITCLPPISLPITEMLPFLGGQLFSDILPSAEIISGTLKLPPSRSRFS